MIIAVTAATGRLGKATLKSLSASLSASQIVAIARDTDRIEASGVLKRQGDYASAKQMRGALDGVDTVIMISAPVVDGTDRVALHRNVIGAARDAGVRRIIFTSVIGGPGEEDTGFAPTQAVNRQTEKDIQSSGLEWVIARNGLYLELDLGHIIQAAETGVYRNNGGAGRCGYISINEIAFALSRMAMTDQCGGQIVNLTSENKSQSELVTLANEIYSLAVRYEPMSASANIERFMAHPAIAARGESVARMLTGCFECIEKGVFEVASDYQQAAGRPPKTIRQQFAEMQSKS